MHRPGILPALIMALALATVALTSSPASGQTATEAAMKDYADTISHADALMVAGDYHEAVRQYERANRVAYNNKLDIDKTVLNGKLAAARTARDAQQSAAAQAAPAATSAADRGKGAAATAPGQAGAALTPMQDYLQTVKYGDDLAAAGEYLEAVKSYERARRLAYNNKLETDSAALAAKMALASSARDAKPVSSGELVPPPPPPVPHPPGETNEGYVADHPGKMLPWVQTNEAFVTSGLRVTPAEMKDLRARLQSIGDVVRRTPLLNTPLGFDVYSSYSLHSFEAGADLKDFLAKGLPLRADTFFSFPGYFTRHVRSKTTGETQTRFSTDGELHCGLRFYVNIVPRVSGIEDAEGEFGLEPTRIGEIGGLPVYDDKLVIARSGDELWVPVTTRRLLRHVLPLYQMRTEGGQRSNAEDRKRNEEYLSPEQMAKRRQEEATVRAKGGSNAEYEARHLEAMHRRWEEDARTALAAGSNDPKQLPRMQADAQIYKDAQAMLDSGDPSVLDAPTCVIAEPKSSPESWKIVPAGTAGCRRVVQPNPRLLNPRLPRAALQIIYVDNILDSTRYLAEEKVTREDPGDCVAVTKLIRQLDWHAIAALLER